MRWVGHAHPQSALLRWAHAAALVGLMLAMTLGVAPAQAAGSLQISVSPGTSSSFGVPGITNSLQITVKNVGNSSLSFSPTRLNFTLQFPPHVVPSFNAPGDGALVCVYVSGDTRTTGVLVTCPTVINYLAAGSSTVVNTYILPDGNSVGVSGTIKAALEPTAGITQVDASSCTATGQPTSGCYVGSLAAPYSSGKPIATMAIGAPSTTAVWPGP